MLSMNSSSLSEIENPKKTIMMAIYNMKGGVAKTTSSLEIGYLTSKAGLKVLLVDADMQANLTTKFIYSTCIAGIDDGEESDDDKGEAVERAYDEMWKQIKVSEVTVRGELKAFHHILQQFTGVDPQFFRDDLTRIKPFRAKTSKDDQVLDLIAGHLTTGDYDDAVGDGFKNNLRKTIPGLVCNIIREFSEREGYDLVIFDLGPYLSPIARAILLGVDYIASPFRCERDCVTAAEIVPRKLRDWHKRHLEDSTKPNPSCALEIRDWYDEYVEKQNPEREKNKVSSRLRCFPVFVGAFPIAVSTMNKSPTKDSAKYIKLIFDAYDSLGDYNRLFHAPRSGVTKAPEPEFEKLRSVFVENSARVGMQASSAQDGIPCVGWYADNFKGSAGVHRAQIKDLLKKARKVEYEYLKVFTILVDGMRPEDKKYILSGMSFISEHVIDDVDVVARHGHKEPKKRTLSKDDMPMPALSFFPRKRITRGMEDKVKHLTKEELAEILRKIFDSEVDDPELAKTIQKSFEDHKKSGATKSFNDRMVGYGLTIQDNEGLGNCFFLAIADQLREREIGLHDHDSLRLEAATFMVTNIEEYRPFITGLTNESPSEYLERVFETGEWADEPVINALARAMDITIVIVRSDGAEPNEINPGADRERVYLGYYVGVHYVSLRGEPNPELRSIIEKPNLHAAGLRK